MDLARNILKHAVHFNRLCEGYPRDFLADPWIWQGISLGSLLNILGFVRDTLIRDFLADPWISQGISLRYLFFFPTMSGEGL